MRLGREYEKSLKNTDSQPPLELATLFNSLSRMHQERESYNEARHAMLLMVQVYEMRGVTRQSPNVGLAKVLGNLGNVAAMLEKHNEAIEYLRCVCER